MGAWRYGPDGALEVTASRVSFALTGIGSALIGAVVGFGLDRYLGERMLAYSTASVFAFWSVRALIQATFVPQLLTLRFAEDSVEGPRVWWLFRERIVAANIDWSRTGETAGRLHIDSRDGRRIYTRLAWYGDEASAVIRERLERYRHGAVA